MKHRLYESQPGDEREREKERRDSEWLEESRVATTSEHRQARVEGKRDGCRGVTPQATESRVTALGQEGTAPALNTHRLFQGGA